MFDVAATITGAYVFVWRERLKFVWLSLPAVFVLTAISVLITPSGTAGAQAGAGIHLLALLAATQFAVAWHRHQLLPDQAVRLRGVYLFGRPQRYYFFSLLGIGLLTAPIFIGVGYFSFYASGIVVDLKSPWFQAAAWLISLPLLAPVLLIYARLALCFPAAAIDRRLSFPQGWRQTRGFGWPLFVLILLAWGPSGLFSTAALMLASRFANPGTPSGQALFYLLTFAGYFLVFLATAVLASALSMAYRLLAADSMTPDPSPAPRQRMGIGRWLVNASIAGTVFGGIAFVAGFFIYPIYQPSNLAPLLGFVLAPLGFLLGFLIGLVWNVGKLGPSRLAGVGVIIGLIILGWGLLMTPYFIPGFIARGMLLDAEAVPSALKKPLAPAGVLRIWAIDIPPEKRAKYLDGLGHAVGGPILELRGHYTVSFHAADAVTDEIRQARAEQRGPDILASDDAGLIGALSREPGIEARLAEVVGNFSYRHMGRSAFIDRTGPNQALARKLALRHRECWDRTLAEATSPYLRFELEQWSVDTATAIVKGEAGERRARSVAGPMRLEHAPMDIHGPVRIESSHFCGAWGSQNLAFARVVINFEAEQTLGRRELNLAMHREDENWRLLSVSESAESHESIKASALRFEQIMLNRRQDSAVPQAATPREPYEYVPSNDIKQRSGYLVWEPSPSRNVVAEVAEIACRSRDLSGAEHDDIQLALHVREPQGTPKYYVHAGKACPEGWPWKWRLWTVTGGGLLFSEEHAIPIATE